MNKELGKAYNEALKKEYRIKLYPVKDDTSRVEWAAEIPELPGCVGGGDTPQEALVAVEDAKKAWIEIALTDNKKIPEPKMLDETDYSGKFTLRLPKSLHKDLAEEAEEEDLSLNQYLLYLITKHHHKSKTSKKKVIKPEKQKHPLISNYRSL